MTALRAPDAGGGAISWMAMERCLALINGALMLLRLARCIYYERHYGWRWDERDAPHLILSSLSYFINYRVTLPASACYDVNMPLYTTLVMAMALFVRRENIPRWLWWRCEADEHNIIRYYGNDSEMMTISLAIIVGVVTRQHVIVVEDA